MRKVDKITEDEIWVTDRLMNWDTFEKEPVVYRLKLNSFDPEIGRFSSIKVQRGEP